MLWIISLFFFSFEKPRLVFLYLAARNDSITSSTNHGLESNAAPPVMLRADRVRHHRDGNLLQDIWHNGT